MKAFELKDVPCGFFSKPLYLDSGFILTAPETPIADDLLRTLDKWGFSEVLSDGEPCESYSAEAAQETKETVIGDRSTIADLDKIQKAESFYLSFQKYVKNLYAFLPVRNELDFNAIAEEIKSVCDFIRDNRRFLMRTQ